jgi:predicted metal-dependent hydrolase
MKSIAYGTRTICYSLQRADRKTLAITVEPDMSVVVTAPQEAEEEAIERIVRKRAAWILCQQRFFAQFVPRTPPRQYISGETHLYLGRQYRLRIRQAESEAVKLIGGYLYVYVKELPEPCRVQELLNGWYSQHARIKLHERLEACMQQVSGWNIATPPLSIRPLKTCWGSCSPTGKLTLNVDLIRAPRACIDYVILHEICHLRHPNHTREFYKLLSLVVPDWRERKIRLERLLS